jgi:hypothetical protein
LLDLLEITNFSEVDFIGFDIGTSVLIVPSIADIVNGSGTFWRFACGVGCSLDGGTGNWSYNLQLDASPVPLPAALPLFAAGLSAMGFMGWRKRRAAS